MQILIAEDEEFSRSMLEGLLESLGHEVTAVSNGAEALAKIEAGESRFLITDWLMPEMDGLELVRRVRSQENAAYVYIILLTAKSQQTDVVQGIMEGADDFLTKPFDPEELRVRLRAGERILELEDRLNHRNTELGAAKQVVERSNERMKANLDAAAKVQELMLPARDLAFGEARFSWHFDPCDELAGDHLNIVPLNRSEIGFFVLDVAGHGVSSALLAVSVNLALVGILTDANGEPTSPAKVVSRLSQLFGWSEFEKFITLVFCVFDTESCECRFTCAGHPSPLLRRLSGELVETELPGYPIGLFQGEDYDEAVLKLQPGDQLLLYSDGMFEAIDNLGKQFGTSRLRTALQELGGQDLKACIDSLVDRVSQWREGTAQDDDMSLLGLQLGNS